MKLKKFQHYLTSELKLGDIIILQKIQSSSDKSLSVYGEIAYTSPDGQCGIKGLGDDAKEGKFMTHVDFIYRNYRLDPGEALGPTHKNFTSFTRTPCSKQ